MFILTTTSWTVYNELLFKCSSI